MGSIKAIVGFLELIVSHFSHLLKFVSPFLKFEQVKVSSLDPFVVVAVFVFFLRDAFSHAVDFQLVAGPFVLHFLQLEAGGVDVFSECVAVVGFGLDVSLVLENLGFPSGDLVSEGRDLDLHVVVGSALIIKMEPSIITLLF